jgi:hypothetical protein
MIGICGGYTTFSYLQTLPSPRTASGFVWRKLGRIGRPPRGGLARPLLAMLFTKVGAEMGLAS